MERHVDDLNSKHIITKGIIGHRKDDNVAIKKEDGWIYHKGARKRVITTKGWEIDLELTDGTTVWCPITTVKHLMLIEVAEYAVANDISTQPTFAWWVTRTLWQRDNIINSIRVPKKLMKYGLKIPGSV